MSRYSSVSMPRLPQLGEDRRQPLGALAVRVDARQLRAEVHVEPDAARRAASSAATCADVHDVVVRNAELVPLAARLDVVVRRLERDFGIDAQRDARRACRARAASRSMSRTSASLSALISRTPASSASRELALRLADAAEDDVRRRESGAQRAIQLAARHDVDAGAELAQQSQHAAARVGLERVVNSVRHRRERARRAARTDRESSPRCRRTTGVPDVAAMRSSGDALAVQRAVDAAKTRSSVRFGPYRLGGRRPPALEAGRRRFGRPKLLVGKHADRRLRLLLDLRLALRARRTSRRRRTRPCPSISSRKSS